MWGSPKSRPLTHTTEYCIKLNAQEYLAVGIFVCHKKEVFYGKPNEAKSLSD